MANEKRLIAATEVEKSLLLSICSRGKDCDRNAPVIVRALTDALRRVEYAPTVDAVEVVHGFTIPADQPKKVLLDRKCGICDSLMLSTDAYCPSCGAKMDGERKDNG